MGKRLKILLSAYACRPGYGGESGIGWNVALQVSKFHEVTVLTRTRNRPLIEPVLIGPKDGAEGFALRYFEVQPGGNSAFEHHPWIHEVYVVRGRGTVLIGDVWHEIAEGDAVFIGPDEQHQLKADADAPLGFLCVATKP